MTCALVFSPFFLTLQSLSRLLSGCGASPCPHSRCNITRAFVQGVITLFDAVRTRNHALAFLFSLCSPSKGSPGIPACFRRANVVLFYRCQAVRYFRTAFECSNVLFLWTRQSGISGLPVVGRNTLFFAKAVWYFRTAFRMHKYTTMVIPL